MEEFVGKMIGRCLWLFGALLYWALVVFTSPIWLPLVAIMMYLSSDHIDGDPPSKTLGMGDE